MNIKVTAVSRCPEKLSEVASAIQVITRGDILRSGATVGTGSYLWKHAAMRHGGKVGSEFSYRLYGMGSDRGPTFLPDGNENTDAWYIMQGGFSTDWNPSETDAVVVHGNVYSGTHDNVPDESNLEVQIYYDRTGRRAVPSTLTDETETYDLGFDHQFLLGDRHKEFSALIPRTFYGNIACRF